VEGKGKVKMSKGTTGGGSGRCERLVLVKCKERGGKDPGANFYVKRHFALLRTYRSEGPRGKYRDSMGGENANGNVGLKKGTGRTANQEAVYATKGKKNKKKGKQKDKKNKKKKKKGKKKKKNQKERKQQWQSGRNPSKCLPPPC